MHSRDPWEVHRLIHLLYQTRLGDPRALLLAHSLAQQLQSVDCTAMAQLHGTQLSHADKETLNQILQASLDHPERVSWWTRFARLSLPGVDIRLKLSNTQVEIQIACAAFPNVDDKLTGQLHSYLLHYTHSRMIHGLNELGLIDIFSFPKSSSCSTIELPPSKLRPSSIPATRAREQCLQSLALLPCSESDLGIRVHTWLAGRNDYPTIDDCAEAFDTSSRTLNRKLAMLGIKFNGIQEHLRSIRALQGLQHHDVPIWQLADELGYDNQANFGRACRRWFGQSPRSIRETLNPAPQQELRW
ncbi:helix-turn-helix transcriptional regulator [Oceanobacter mangrovi]|uniref:helix-turn-helix transcriptional regulator n=1 Tax=Oceanobacter mangrovi TaxID=2862510 RepID=UPI001C8EA3EC|nr:helix-turn-helix transcriptional regulator [Oceanobacter mangrovi]